MAPTKIPALVGHRGWPARYPENTLEGFAAAVGAGARWLECDVQVSADGVPFVCHDLSLKRTAGIDREITEIPAVELISVTVGEGPRFGERYAAVKLAPLTTLITWLETQPQVTLFVEIKRQSLRHFGGESVVRSVLAACQAALKQCAIISFDHVCLGLARTQGAPVIGWATEEFSLEIHQIARTLEPDYLFTSDERFADVHNALNGPWQWAVYQTQDPQRAMQLAAQGADLVETNDIGVMLKSPEFAPP
ncbi:MAG: glycerophosphodiester phosphodiesterase family protein [Gammaproteobacteria bacterium]